MKNSLSWMAALAMCVSCLAQTSAAQSVDVVVTIENIAPEGGVAITPVWSGFHSGSFDSYNGGLTSLEGLERVAEDGNTALISQQFNDFDPVRGGYTYVDNSGAAPESRLVRTGDLSDANRVDATIGSAPLLPGQSASAMFELMDDGSNDYFSYTSMILPTNDFFIANGNPLAHDVGGILSNGGEISFLIGTPEGGVNDAGTEREDFESSAGNGLFPNRNLPAGQSGPNVGRSTNAPIANVTGDAFQGFRLFTRADKQRILAARKSELLIRKLLRPVRRLRTVRAFLAALRYKVVAFEDSLRIDTSGFNFNDYEGGVARVTITAIPR
jgi:hypothetical protein